MSLLPEFKIRYLVNELAKDIVEIDDILVHLGISREEYIKLSSTRAFKEALISANTEWQGATNTVKRVKLKAAAITEELMLKIFMAARDAQESLSAKTKAFEAISKIAGLGALEPVASLSGSLGNVFNLQINYSNGSPPDSIQIGASNTSPDSIIEGDYSESEELESDDSESEELENYSEGVSKVFTGEFEEL